jgi:hypothetical protein
MVAFIPTHKGMGLSALKSCKRFSFSSVDTGLCIYEVGLNQIYGKYGNTKYEMWKPYSILGGLKPDHHQYGQKSEWNDKWCLWDRSA